MGSLRTHRFRLGPPDGCDTAQRSREAMVRIRRATLCRRRSSISQRQGFSPRASLACVHAQECSLRALPKARTAPKVHEPGLAQALRLISYSSKTVPSVSCVVPDALLRRFEMPVALPAGPGLKSNVATAIDAVYEGGLLRPLQPLSLPEHAQVRNAPGKRCCASGGRRCVVADCRSRNG